MKIRLLLLALCFTAWGCITPEQIPSGNTTTPAQTGYDIVLTNISHAQENKPIYLYGYDCLEVACIDSATVFRGRAEFKNKNNIPRGIYTISSIPNAYSSEELSQQGKDIVFNQSTRFYVNLGEHLTTNSEENNQLFRYYEQKAAATTPALAQSVFNSFTATSPSSFVSKYIRATETIGTPITSDAAFRQQLNAVDFSDTRLLHVPNSYIRNILDYIVQPESQEASACIAKMDALLSRCPNAAVRNYYIRALFSLLNVHNPDYDPVLVYLYDHYDHTWIESGSEKRIERKINNLRKIIPGAQIPELISHDIHGKAHSTNDIQRRYTVLWFWDPDCDHCQEMTPPLHRFYQEHGRDYDFEVFAVEVNDDYDRWKTFSDKHQLWDWTNLSTSRGEQNIDFIEYFDIMTTPVILLIDNSQNHTIIKRQITLDELRLFFSKK